MSTMVTQKPSIEKWEHTDFGLEIPYYDEELGMSQSEEHEIAINYLSYVFKFIAKKLGFKAISDHPVWYMELTNVQTGDAEQKKFYPDLVLSRNLDVSKIGADEIMLALEVVSTERKAKEIKDTDKMKGLNAFNKIPEFILIYPKVSDNRVIEWFYLEGNEYVPIERNEQGEYHSQAIQGLSIRELPREDWRDGAKVEVLYDGQVLVSYEEVWELLEEEKQRAKSEKFRADKAEIEKGLEKKRADLYAQKLRELGIDPTKL
ncbi:MAG: Uma2 family endonuclease [Leptospiraceae bacterium]|nr:Uma2 family endonuclease [Leptospiraceae bacterium]